MTKTAVTVTKGMPEVQLGKRSYLVQRKPGARTAFILMRNGRVFREARAFQHGLWATLPTGRSAAEFWFVPDGPTSLRPLSSEQVAVRMRIAQWPDKYWTLVSKYDDEGKRDHADLAVDLITAPQDRFPKITDLRRTISLLLDDA